MTDINDQPPPTLRARRSNGGPTFEETGRAKVPDVDLIGVAELLFFAYRDFISDPDTDLSKLGFGRAHHRVLHFVNRHPGLRVADLLDILNITKQSLGRVLKQLIDEGYVSQTAGHLDRRERLLYPTERGHRLATRLMAPQLERIANALQMAGMDGEKVVQNFLHGMVGKEERAKVAELITAGRTRRKGPWNES